MATARWFSGEVQRAEGNEREAAASFAQALQVYTAFGDRLGTSGCLGGIACLLAARQDWAAAGRLFGAAATLKERTQSFLPPTHEVAYNATAQTVILAGGMGSFEAGQRLSQAEAVEEALVRAHAIASGKPTSPVTDGREKGLTRTQRQVLLHFAEGHEAKTIATILGKSRNTVYEHLKNLCTHFNCDSYDELRQQARRLGLANDANDSPTGA
jgi:DNA-binding CsgD family transcriptional regulator